jgi:hypothetical protein
MHLMVLRSGMLSYLAKMAAEKILMDRTHLIGSKNPAMGKKTGDKFSSQTLSAEKLCNEGAPPRNIPF